MGKDGGICAGSVYQVGTEVPGGKAARDRLALIRFRSEHQGLVWERARGLVVGFCPCPPSTQSPHSSVPSAWAVRGSLPGAQGQVPALAARVLHWAEGWSPDPRETERDTEPEIDKWMVPGLGRCHIDLLQSPQPQSWSFCPGKTGANSSGPGEALWPRSHKCRGGCGSSPSVARAPA